MPWQAGSTENKNIGRSLRASPKLSLCDFIHIQEMFACENDSMNREGGWEGWLFVREGRGDGEEEKHGGKQT